MCVSQNGEEVNSVIWPGKFLHTGQTVLRAWIHILWRVTVQVPVMKGEQYIIVKLILLGLVSHHLLKLSKLMGN